MAIIFGDLPNSNQINPKTMGSNLELKNIFVSFW